MHRVRPNPIKYLDESFQIVLVNHNSSSSSEFVAVRLSVIGAMATVDMTNGLQLAADIASEEEEEEEDEEEENASDDSEAERDVNTALIGADGVGDNSDGDGAEMEDGSGAENEESESGAFSGRGRGPKEGRSRKGTSSGKDKVGRKAVDVMWMAAVLTVHAA